MLSSPPLLLSSSMLGESRPGVMRSTTFDSNHHPSHGKHGHHRRKTRSRHGGAEALQLSSSSSHLSSLQQHSAASQRVAAPPPFSFSSPPAQLDALEADLVLPFTPPTILSLPPAPSSSSAASSSFILSFPSYFSSFLYSLSLSPSTLSLLHFSSYFYFRLQQRRLIVLLQLLYYKSLHSHGRAHAQRDGAAAASASSCPLSLSSYSFPEFYSDFTSYAQAAVDCYCSHWEHVELYLQANRTGGAGRKHSEHQHAADCEEVQSVVDSVLQRWGEVRADNWAEVMRSAMLPFFLRRMTDEYALPIAGHRCRYLAQQTARREEEEETAAGSAVQAEGRRDGRGLWRVLREWLRKDMLVKTLSVQRQFAMLWEKHKILRRRASMQQDSDDDDAGDDDDEEEEEEEGEGEESQDGEEGEDDEQQRSDSADDSEEMRQQARARLECTTAMMENRQQRQHEQQTPSSSTDSEPSSPSSSSTTSSSTTSSSRSSSASTRSFAFSGEGAQREILIRQCANSCPYTPSPSPHPRSPPFSPSMNGSHPAASPSHSSSMLLTVPSQPHSTLTASPSEQTLQSHRPLPDLLLHRSESATHLPRKHSSSSASHPQLHPVSLQPLPHSSSLHHPHIHAHPHRRRPNPIVVFLGGGMSAGKSTVLSHLRQLRAGLFHVHSDAVYIESDRFKLSDPVYVSMREDDPDRSLFVHGYSVRVAEEALLSAVRARRDVVIDGTCAWKEYVVQTVRMIRRSEEAAWKRGEGMRADGTESYWEEVPDAPLPWAMMAGAAAAGAETGGSGSISASSSSSELLEAFPALAYSAIAQSLPVSAPAISSPHYSMPHLTHSASTTSLLPPPPPYLIAMLGVTAPVSSAISRAIRRAVITGRTVPIAALRTSYALFAAAFEDYTRLVDAYLLYENSVDEMQFLPDASAVSAAATEERKEKDGSLSVSAPPLSPSAGLAQPHPALLASKHFDQQQGVVHQPELYERFVAQGRGEKERSEREQAEREREVRRQPQAHSAGRCGRVGSRSEEKRWTMSEKLQLLLRQVDAGDDDDQLLLRTAEQQQSQHGTLTQS